MNAQLSGAHSLMSASESASKFSERTKALMKIFVNVPNCKDIVFYLVFWKQFKAKTFKDFGPMGRPILALP